MRVKGLNKMPGIQWVLGKYLFPSVYENHFKKMAYCGERGTIRVGINPK